uniref:Large ribosomal subunit protein bL35c n=1 Tax=Laurencia australis TaxID=3073067 RepID=A0AA51RB37_9FLOR|nr:50S ribosomal protein L35 [Laurencia australis]WMP12066.1 50S ribosomal protein L35 [Laurencia australis]
MYKLKTVKSVSKRFKISSSGKFLRHYSCKSHLLQKKSSIRKRKLRRTTVIDYSDHYSLNYTLPYR